MFLRNLFLCVCECVSTSIEESIVFLFFFVFFEMCVGEGSREIHTRK